MLGAYRVVKRGVFQGDFWITLEQGDLVVVEQMMPSGEMSICYLKKGQIVEALCRGEVERDEDLELMGL